MATPRIILNNLSYHLENIPVSLDQLTLTFDQLKYGIIGDNGVGKTTFLKLLSGELLPTQGSIQRSGIISQVPQTHSHFPQSATIQDVLSVTDIVNALGRIGEGDCQQEDFDCVADYWDIETRIEKALCQFDLWPINLKVLFSTLSGGQKTKVLLAKTLIFPADFILFDEPTNNLDQSSRQILYQYIESTPVGMIVVSHDRTLLNKMERIIEITSKTIVSYGGNYDFYKNQKATTLNAIQHEIQARVESLKKSKQLIQTRMERHQQNEAKGRKNKKAEIKAKGCYDKMGLKKQKGRSERTNRRIRIQADRKLEYVNKQLDDAKEKFEVKESIDVNLSSTRVPNGKVVLEIEDLCFRYPGMKNFLINHFNLTMIGPTRLAIVGPNGCGKSTLIKLIRKKIQAQSGTINIGIDTIAYLDQNISFLNSSLNLVDIFLQLNPKLKAFDAYSALAAFNFRNKQAEKMVKNLSGGERMRAGLAICLMSAKPPQLIILDEPTNHLDLRSIQSIENSLKLYQGAILAISHDESFIHNINIQQIVTLND